MASSSGPKSKGRSKINMEKIGNPTNLQVTFSKRRKGAFKKAHELSILTGAQVATVVFSPNTGKPYSYGHPSAETVINRFLTGTSQPLTETEQHDQNKRDAKVVATYAEITRLKRFFEEEKIYGVKLDNLETENQTPQLGKINWDENDQSKTKHLAEVLKDTEGDLERKMNSKLNVQQRHMVRAGEYNNSGGVRGFSPLPLVGPTFEGNVSSNRYGVTNIGGRDGIDGNSSGYYPFLLGPNFYGVSSRNALPSSTGLGLYGNARGLSFNYERWQFEAFDGRVGTNIGGLSSSIGGDGDFSNTYHSEHNPLGGGDGSGEIRIRDSRSLIREGSGFPNTGMASSFGVVDGGGQTSIEGPSSLIRGSDSFPNTYIASSLSNVPNPHGQFVGPSSYVGDGSDVGLPNVYGSNYSVGGGDDLPNTYGATSSGIGFGEGTSNSGVSKRLGSMPPNDSVGEDGQN